MIKPIGKAAIIETVCKFAMELSEKRSAIGSRIKRMDQKSLSRRSGSSSLDISR